MKMKKLLSLILAGVTTMSLVGCGSSTSTSETTTETETETKTETETETETETKTETASPESTATKEVANLTIWSPTDKEAIETWWVEKLGEWNKAHPEIQVSREAIDRADSYAYENKITAAVTSGDLPDILYVDGPTVSYYAANDIIVPITEYFTSDELSDFMPATVQQGTYDNSLYALSATESSVALFYNKDYLDAANIEYPSREDLTKTWTWSQYYENSAKLTTNEYVGTTLIMDKGEGLIYALGQFWTENGTTLINENGSKASFCVNSPASVETAEYLAKFIENGYANIDPVQDEFMNGYSATMLGGTWNIADLEKSDLNWGVAYFPIADSGEASSPTGDWTAAVTKDCENVDAAGEFLQWLMNKENVASFAEAVSKPATRISAYELMEGWDEGARALMKWQLENTGTARPSTPSYSVLSADFAEALLNIFTGADAQAELDAVATSFDEDYTTYYSK